MAFNFFGTVTGCVGSHAIVMDEQVCDGHFAVYYSFHNLTFPEGSQRKQHFNTYLFKKKLFFFMILPLKMMKA